MKLSVVESSNRYKKCFVDFNIKIYPERKTTEEQALYKWELQFHSQSSPHLLALNDEQVVGQIILFPAHCYYNNQKSPCVFAYDYIVQPEYLNTGVGVKLLSKTIKSHIHFGIGLSELSRKLHLTLKEKPIGNIHKYVYTKNILSYFFAGVNTYLKMDFRRLPAKLSWKDNLSFNSFKAIRVLNLPDQQHAWNPDLIEFARDEKFSNVRFNMISPKYVFYEVYNAQNNLTGYFVLRVEIWRGMRVLIVVDYRLKIGDEEAMNIIVKSAKTLMKLNKLDAILFGSSLHWVDKELLKNKFKKVGLPSEIVTNLTLDSNWEVKALDRNFIMATPADSDFEFNLGSELWKRKSA